MEHNHSHNNDINLALDAVPENINIGEISEFLNELPDVSGVHDLHVWALRTTDDVLTVHFSAGQQTDIGFITSIQKQLHERFRIEHATIQIEFGS